MLYSAIDGHVGIGRRTMPFENIFLVLPLILHAPTRAILPKQVGSPFQSWVSTNPTVRVGFADRIRAATPITREALIYMMTRDCIKIEGGAINLGTKRPKMASKKIMSVSDIRGSLQAAAMLGRLLAGAGTSATIYTALGITP